MSDEQFMQRAMELADNYANANALAELEDTSGDDLSPAEREAETARIEPEEHLRAGIVPRTPTSAMLAAGQAAWLRDPMRRSTALWEAMYAAAADKQSQWCSHCGCGNDTAGYAHAPLCPSALSKASPPSDRQEGGQA